MRSAVFDRGMFYTTEQISEKQSLTPDGFLLCEDVPVARIGVQVYGPQETPIPPGPNGLVFAHRDEDQIFRKEFMASLNGKPVVNEHPSSLVTPDNWKQLTVGVGMNPRRGTGMQADLLLMDLLITDQTAIELVRSGKREISLGYETDWDEMEQAGHTRQYNLKGNHIALVENGRCGLRCAIGDRNRTGEPTMVRDKAYILRDRAQVEADIRAAFKAKDDTALEEALKRQKVLDAEMVGEEGEHTHIHLHGTTDEEKEEEEKKAKDAARKAAKDAEEEEEKEKEKAKDSRTAKDTATEKRLENLEKDVRS
ncbi:MAG: DUF2213 domain-containing protein, partial [Limisphaerales bacterium]